MHIIPKKILVTGANGFIGSHIVNEYINQGHHVIAIDNNAVNLENNLNSKTEFYHCNLLNKKQLKNIFKIELPDIVNHHAGHIQVSKSFENPTFDAKQNIIATINLLDLSKQYNIKKFIFASSGGAIYGNTNRAATETDQSFSLSPYAASKKSAEIFIETYFNLYKLNYLILRYSNVYGPKQNLKFNPVIPTFISRIINKKKPFIFGDGEQTRDFIYIKDIVKANNLALNTTKNGIFNISAAKSYSINQILNIIKKILPFQMEPRYINKINNNVINSLLSNNKAKTELKWQPETNIQDGIKETIHWYQQQYNKNNKL